MPIHYLLDTNVMEHLANRANGWDRIERRIEKIGIDVCAISSITAYELRRHIERGPGRVRKENTEHLKVIFSRVAGIALDVATAEIAGRIAAQLEDQGTPIGPHDPMIAATAIAHGLICVTDNTKHFARVPGLTIQNWRAAGNGE